MTLRKAQPRLNRTLRLLLCSSDPTRTKRKPPCWVSGSQGVQRTLLVLPTGCGKTIVFAKISEDCVKRGERVLILAHRGELLEQAADKIHKACNLNCSVEKAEETSLGSFWRITVGSVQTLMRESRLARFMPDYFDTIIIDEAHHAVSDSYQRILQHFSGAKVLGVTATPDRGDMKNLGQVFDSLAYEYTLPRAIREGYLCPIKALTIPLNLDLTGVSVQAGDFRAADLDTALEPYLYQIADEMLRNWRRPEDGGVPGRWSRLRRSSGISSTSAVPGGGGQRKFRRPRGDTPGFRIRKVQRAL